MNAEQANLIPLAQILAAMGYSPVRSNGDDHWYRSPFRQNGTASFYINVPANTWQDQDSENSSGNSSQNSGGGVDLAIRHLKASGEDHTVADALRWLNNMVVKPVPVSAPAKQQIIQLPSWRLKRTGELEDLALIRYAEKRGIPFAVAGQHFVEAYVQNSDTGERMYALGFKNEDGGYELRNIFIRSCAAPKTITFKRGDVAKPNAVHLFEGSFDYLSALIRYPQYISRHDCIILNSVACLEHALPYLKGYGYQTLYSWMDNDVQGMNTTKKITAFARSQAGLTHKPLNGFYRNFKDVNDWHQATFGLEPAS